MIPSTTFAKLSTAASSLDDHRGRSIGWLLVVVAALALPATCLRGSAYLGSSDLHATIEMVGSLLGLAAGFAFALRYYAIGNRLLLFIGLAYVVNGAEDFAHGLLAFRYTTCFTGVDQETLRQFIPGTYVTGRLLFGVIMLSAQVLAERGLVLAAEDRGRVTWWYSGVAGVLAVAGTLVAFNLPLPKFIFPEHVISRPIDLLSAGIIGAAFLSFLHQYRVTGSRLTFWIAVSLGVNVAGQIIMARSTALFDASFDLAHVYKIVGYVIPTIGFSVLQVADLRRSEENSAELWEVLDRHTLLSITDAEGNLIYVNDGYCHLSGFSRDQLIGGKQPIVPTHEAESCDRMWEELRSGNTWRAEVAQRRADGDSFWVDATIVPRMAKEGHLRRCISLQFDINEKKQLETRLAQTRRLEAIGQLAAGVAHEINTPMQFISANVKYLKEATPQVDAIVERLREELAAEDFPSAPSDRLRRLEALIEETRYDRLTAEAANAVSDCEEGAKRVIEIVRAMKVFSHPGSAEKGPASLNDLVRSAATVSRNHWKYLAEVEFQLDPALPDINCFSAEISQVLVNLIVNAADAIAEKRSEEDPLGTITLRTVVNGDEVVLECQDTGAGIPASVVDRLFEPFFTTKPIGKGSGQGLAITHDVIVNKHGGTIDIDTLPGEGSTFAIRLPLRPDKEASDDASPALTAATS